MVHTVLSKQHSLTWPGEGDYILESMVEIGIHKIGWI